jgi:hypothetical protein
MAVCTEVVWSRCKPSSDAHQRLTIGGGVLILVTITTNANAKFASVELPEDFSVCKSLSRTTRRDPTKATSSAAADDRPTMIQE